MSQIKKRPVNLNLISFKFPLPALVSIGHRISGVVLFLAMPLFLFSLSYALASAEHFLYFIKAISNHFFLSLTAWLSLLALLYHLLAGVRHLIMDLGYGESFVAARYSAAVVFALFLICVVLTGVWIW